jgi:hypothetical protein
MAEINFINVANVAVIGKDNAQICREGNCPQLSSAYNPQQGGKFDFCKICTSGTIPNSNEPLPSVLRGCPKGIPGSRTVSRLNFSSPRQPLGGELTRAELMGH